MKGDPCRLEAARNLRLESDAQAEVCRHAVALFGCRKAGLLVDVEVVLAGEVVDVEEELHPVPGQILLHRDIPAGVLCRIDPLLQPEIRLLEDVVLIQHREPCAETRQSHSP